ncbi:N,N'-diacetylchitobiose phosphorylase, partial [Eubacteriales bacterium OttesenSCG-928-A19]|nr:N,N'-diacetylchitobiose phosphorylase [Eubacteriales bacterium OttesenSCG-928-A19]
LGGGESAMVSFLHLWALEEFIDLAQAMGQAADVAHYREMAERVRGVCRSVLWDGKWFLRGITGKGDKIGTRQDAEGRVHMESNTWAVISGAADPAQGLSAMDSVDEYLYTDYGLMLNAPSYRTPNDDIGFVTRVYPGVKENGSVFSHPNPWAWIAEARLGRGTRAMKFYDALLPYNQNDHIEVRVSEPYSYCQFIMGRDHAAHGRANHPWMTGTAGWAYFAATQYLLGVRPDFGGLTIDPCIPADWNGFTMRRVWRGATYHITVKNPDHVEKGVREIRLDGQPVETVPAMAPGSAHTVEVRMG